MQTKNSRYKFMHLITKSYLEIETIATIMNAEGKDGDGIPFFGDEELRSLISISCTMS